MNVTDKEYDKHKREVEYFGFDSTIIGKKIQDLIDEITKRWFYK